MKTVLSKTEVRKAFDVIKLIKTVYTGKIFVSPYNMAQDIVYECVDNPKTNKIFNYGYFTHIEHMLPAQMCGTILDVMTCYEAFKNKCDIIEIKSNNIVELSNGDATYPIGMVLDKKVSLNYYMEGAKRVLPFFETLSDIQAGDGSENTHYEEIECGAVTIGRLIGYETITIRCEEENDVGIILTCKCLPNIKKCEKINLGFMYKDDQEMVQTFVGAVYKDAIEYRMVLSTLRC